jgi:hypothetical protein
MAEFINHQPENPWPLGRGMNGVGLVVNDYFTDYIAYQ